MKQITLAPDRRLSQWSVLYLLFQLLVLPYLLELLFFFLKMPLDNLRLNMLYYTVNFAVLVGIFRRFLLASLRHALENLSQVLLAAVIGFFAYRFSSTLVNMGILALRPDFVNVNDANITTMAQGRLAMWGFSAIVLVPPAEELLFRGVLFGSLYNKNKILAWVVSVVGFCLLHVMGYVGYYPWEHLLICAIQYLPAGICFCAAYRYSGNIFSPILIHTAINVLATLSMAALF